ncbi:hypothetical protein JTB14_034276 [Gonioctena quinquepunctata]|nr:hypothetical protein JTB14_034276 [Gonioctena quinquepunctata]
MWKLYEAEVRQLYDRDLDFFKAIPQFESVKTVLNRHRYNAIGAIKDPVDCENIDWPVNIFELEDNRSFLLFEDGVGKNKVVICATKSGIEAMTNDRNFFMDGTSKSCSKQFYQMYSVDVDIGSIKKETNIIPAVYSLLPDQKTQTCERFIKLPDTHTNWNPILMKIDFEEGAIMAMRIILSIVKITGFNFPFNQWLWRKVQSIGLVEGYRNDESIRLHIWMYASLVFFPVSDVVDGWLVIMENAPNCT